MSDCIFSFIFKTYTLDILSLHLVFPNSSGSLFIKRLSSSLFDFITVQLSLTRYPDDRTYNITEVNFISLFATEMSFFLIKVSYPITTYSRWRRGTGVRNTIWSSWFAFSWFPPNHYNLCRSPAPLPFQFSKGKAKEIQQTTHTETDG